ncbi:Ferric siderophore transport system, periplasmic binding protein TonB [hydrothermal vent metagenome]|uniref:Ferric siderophore transport system, periplasmic binding protein TonB n=1 Tax=hydrothermal vent metagenome TaxID=652676 RepID=A0A1W1D0M5_9ZZZZ
MQTLTEPLHATTKTISLNLQEVLPPSLKPVKKSTAIVKKAKAQKAIKSKPMIQTPKLKTTKAKKAIITKEVLKKQKIIPKENIKEAMSQKKQKENNSSKYQAKEIQKTIKKVIKEKPKPKPKKKEMIQKEMIKEEEPLEAQDNSLSGMLLGFGTSMYTEDAVFAAAQTQDEQKIETLYGSEFDTYSPVQQKYIKHNLNRVQQITQNTLVRNGYPEVAKRTKQLGTNIVSFYLHPNGDISDLTLKHAIGHEALDKNTLSVIEIAYKDYPLPNEKTRLIFHVKYLLY